MQTQAKIDEIDAKILKALLKEARTSFTDLSKICKISIGAVRMRFARLKREGIITGEIALVNPHSFGCKHISDLGIISKIDNEPEVKDFLKTKSYLSHIFGPFGKYSFLAKAVLKDTQQLASILEDLESCQHIKSVDSLIWVDAANIEYPENLVIEPLSNDEIVIPKALEMRYKIAKLDDTDREIARIITKSSRTPFRRIAEKLGISTKNAIQRYRRLRRENVLTRATITVDLYKLGYNATAYMYIKADNRSKIPEIFNQLYGIPNLIVSLRLIGTYDILVVYVLKDFNELFTLKEKLRKIQEIQETELFLTPNVPSWPLNLFPSLLDSEQLEPKVFEGF